MLPKPRVAGSSPVFRSSFEKTYIHTAGLSLCVDVCLTAAGPRTPSPPGSRGRPSGDSGRGGPRSGRGGRPCAVPPAVGGARRAGPRCGCRQDGRVCPARPRSRCPASGGCGSRSGRRPPARVVPALSVRCGGSRSGSLCRSTPSAGASRRCPSPRISGRASLPNNVLLSV